MLWQYFFFLPSCWEEIPEGEAHLWKDAGFSSPPFGDWVFGCSEFSDGTSSNSLSLDAGAGMEGTRQQDLHVHRPSWLAHCFSSGWEIQEDAQKHYDQSDGHSGGRHQETGESHTFPALVMDGDGPWYRKYHPRGGFSQYHHSVVTPESPDHCRSSAHWSHFLELRHSQRDEIRLRDAQTQEFWGILWWSGGKGWRNVGKSKRQELENSTGFKVLFMHMIASDLFTFS